MNLPVNSLLQGGKYRIVRFINSGDLDVRMRPNT